MVHFLMTPQAMPGKKKSPCIVIIEKFPSFSQDGAGVTPERTAPYPTIYQDK